jgi:hypothetical protein
VYEKYTGLANCDRIADEELFKVEYLTQYQQSGPLTLEGSENNGL